MLFALICATAVLRTIAEALALPDAEFAADRPVEIEGLVTAVLRTDSHLIDDGTGRFIFEMADQSKPVRTGDVIRAKGRTNLVLDDGMRQKSLVFDDYAITGRKPPPETPRMSVGDIANGKADFRTVRTRGFVSEVFPDQIDPKWNYLILNGDGEPLYVAVPNDDAQTPDRLNRLIDAEVELVGAGLPHYCAERVFIGPHLELWGEDCITVLRPAPADPFNSPPLEDISHVNPKTLANMHRRRTCGQVLAVWGGNRVLVCEPDGRLVGVELAEADPLPAYGDRIDAVGFPQTDLFHLLLTRACWRPACVPGGNAPRSLKPHPISAREILLDDQGKRKIRIGCHGDLVRMTGTIRTLPNDGTTNGTIGLECDGFLVTLDTSALGSTPADLALGCTVEATGVCILQAENWSASRPFPTIGAITLVPRTEDDLRVLTHPPWWTPGRLLCVIGSLLALIAGAALWIRGLNRVIVRRSHELMREELAHKSAELRYEERLNLAVELHDSLSQNLSGLACQISAVGKVLPGDAAPARERLDIANRMLLSSRTELKRCLWDLRNNALDCRNFADAIVGAVGPLVGTAALITDFDIPRSHLSDTVAHAVLCIIRELAVNAVRHGEAGEIRVTGRQAADGISFTVRDDGRGFDAAHPADSFTGHFGLEGIRDRVARLNGKFKIESQPGGGTLATVTIPLSTETPS